MTAALKKLNLSAFTGVVASATAPDANVRLALIDKKRQVRSKLGDLGDLRRSVIALGILEPVILLDTGDGRYRLIAGERRIHVAEELGLPVVPAIIKRDLTEKQIRQIQVSENQDREGLQPYDEAMGVAEDVETYGFKEAVEIWNRSDAWVSKRAGVMKYAEPVRELLRDQICGDLEVLHSLNQLFGLSLDEYEALVVRLRSGVVVSRDDARNKVAAVKTWKKSAEATAEARREQELIDGGGEGADAAAQGATGSESGEDEQDLPAGDAPMEAGQATKDKTASSSRGAGSGKVTKPNAQGTRASHNTKQQAEAEEERLKRSLHSRRAELMEWGEATGAQFNTLMKEMHALGYEPKEGEWVLWVGFLDSVLPMLASLEKGRGIAYLGRLQAELKKKWEPTDKWRALHSSGDGTGADAAAAGGDPAPTMPKGWTF
jgi:ParB family chromosome partitioning protein